MCEFTDVITAAQNILILKNELFAKFFLYYSNLDSLSEGLVKKYNFTL